MRKDANRMNRAEGPSFSQISDCQSLRAYLFDYTNELQNVGDLVHYCRLGTIEKIVQSKKWRLGNPLTMNDQKEVSDFRMANWKRIFYSSFIADTSENIAMWSLYGRPWANGLRIQIRNEDFIKWIQETRSVYFLENGTYIEAPDIRLSVVRVAYTNELTKGPFDEQILICGNQKNFKIESLFRYGQEYFDPTTLAGAIKDIAWAYENEIRIRADADGDLIPDAVYIDVPDYIIENMIITAGPLFFGSLECRLRSFYDGRLSLDNSKFYNNLQKMPCSDYTTGGRHNFQCEEIKAFELAQKTIISADMISLYSLAGRGVFRFIENGCFTIGEGEYQFSIKWHWDESKLIFEHRTGRSRFSNNIPSISSLYSFDFPSSEETVIDDHDQVFLFVNEYGRTAALKMKRIHIFTDNNTVELEYKVFMGARIEFMDANAYYLRNKTFQDSFIHDHEDPLCGTWWDVNSKRCHMSIAKSNGIYLATIDWANSASENNEWTMTGEWDDDSQELKSSNEKSVTTKYLEDGTVQVTTVYENGISRLYMSESAMFWEDAAKTAGKGCRFVKSPEQF